MIVDDDESSLDILVAALRFSNHDTSTFLSPFDAWKEFSADPEKFDLVIVDYQMPDMSGLMLHEKIQAIAPAKPVILISGVAGSEVEAAFIANGGKGFLAKPINFEKLDELIRQIAAERREKTDIESIISSLAERLVLAESTDLPALAELHTGLEDLAKTFGQTSDRRLAEAARSTAQYVEKLILGEAGDPQEAMAALGQALSAMRMAACDGRPWEEVGFPPAIAMPETAAAGRLPPAVDESIFSDFLAKQDGVLEEIEQLALAMEKNGAGQVLPELQRLLHTLKGEAALVGLANIEHFCHRAEDVFNSAAFTADAVFRLQDWLRCALAHAAGKADPPPEVEGFFRSLFPVTADKARQAEAPPVSAGQVSAALPDKALLAEFIAEGNEYLEALDAHLLELESNPANQEALNAVFRVFHTIKGVAGFLGLAEIGGLAHEAENLLDKARKGELALSSIILEAVFATGDVMRRLVKSLETALAVGRMPDPDKSVAGVVSRLRAAASGEKPAGMATGPAPARQAAVSAESPTGTAAEEAASPSRVAVKETVKVDAERLDRLLDAIGELVIAESMVSQSREIRDLHSTTIERQLAQLDKITRELQEMGTSLRMIPIKSTFQKMARLVRDLAKKSGKLVEFHVSGEETELDKTVVDRIGDPLVHMVRNAVDHGIESTVEERRRAGKPDAGRVELRAFHRGGSIWIEIADDGRGLDREAILAKARQQGLLAADQTPPDAEIYNLIFLPGFSTARKVTDVSGRGVGMDVVRRAIEDLRGQVEIRTEKGRGSVFSIRLPLTLAIIDGMVIRLGSERYIFPTLSLLRTVRPSAVEVETVFGRGEMLNLAGELVPLFRLHRLFAVPGAEEDATRAVAVIVEDEGRKAAILVDEILGKQQIVIKTLGDGLRGVQGLAGGAIMPDGTVGLILDVSALVAMAGRQADDARSLARRSREMAA